jgi:hypothetical protein
METAYSWAAQGGHVRSNSSKTAITAGTLGGTLSGASNDNFDRRHVGGFGRVKNAIIKDTSVRFARARDGLATAEFQPIGLSIGASPSASPGLSWFGAPRSRVRHLSASLQQWRYAAGYVN